MRRAPSPAVILITVAAGIFCAGCDASGDPAFVKISPDSKHVIYQDRFHPKSYVYDVQRRQAIALNGRVACVNANASLLVLRGEPSLQRMTCRLISLDAGSLKIIDLPDLPMAGHQEARISFIGAGPDVVAVMYHTDTGKPSASVRLVANSKTWIEAPVPREWAGQSLSQAQEPIGDRLSGHVYSPNNLRLCKGDEVGLNVKSALSGYDTYYILESPDGDYSVVIHDPEDPWKRLWLSERSGKRTLLLDQNDMPKRIFDQISFMPIGFFLYICGVNI